MAGRAVRVNIVSGERVLAGAIKGIGISAPNAIAEAAATALKKNSDAFTRGLYRAIKKGAIPESRMKATNQAIAEGAQAAILTGWKERLPVNAPPYRRGPRLSGALGSALADSGMTRGTTGRTISFLNTTVLWSEAVHWHRVNYGAFGPNAQIKRPESFPVVVGGHTLIRLHDPGRPDPNSWLPQDYRAARDRTFFQPVRGPADVVGGGHDTSLFTDLGFASVADNVGPAYEAMLRRWVHEEGADAVRKSLYAKGVRVSASVLAH